MRVLLVEDDTLLGDGIQEGLKMGGYAVDWVEDGQSALLAFRTEEYSLCILDLNLPKLDGLSVLRQLRASGNHLPILILTARDSREDKVKGLDLGADDYLTKPFDLDELLARSRALVRRASGSGAVMLNHGSVSLDPTSRRVSIAGEGVTLSGKEYTLLFDLISHPSRIRSRSELEQSLYAWGEEVESNAIEVYIHHLRKKLGSDFIRTVRGMGYTLGDK